ncbi:MAG: elongation factor EF-2 [Candidatus Aenigmarchaeota archaeon]|nr:elongation factor EF-2 [Candidatus Aenigmarchaeota archaeon]
MAKKEISEVVKDLMVKPDQIRNIGIVAHIDHGKTTLSDNLLAGAGMISKDLAGKIQFMDFDPQEQERGITIFAANASMVHEVEGRDYLVNLIDTPGHVDFGGDVTRAIRAVDGVIVVVDAVEAVMPQTETVIRQALKERAKPVLFINKADRLIKELKLTPEIMQERFKIIITKINALIKKYAEEQYGEKWMVSVNDGSVAFGSAVQNWAVSIGMMKKTGISFKEVIDHMEKGESKILAEKSPLHATVLDMVVRHLPNPLQAQKYRVPKIWPGDKESEVAKDMENCNPNGKLAAVVTKIYPDPHAGYVATTRIFSGKVVSGQEVFLVGQGKINKVQQVAIYKGNQRIPMESVNAGNIVGIVGLHDAYSGETLCDPNTLIPGFEAIKHIFEPVVTKAIEPKKPQDLAKFIGLLRKVSREDPTLRVSINEETGEYLVSGLGELHIEAKIERPLKEAGLDVDISPPIVIYHEGVGKQGAQVEARSPNKHNIFWLTAEPLEKGIYEAMVKGEIEDIEVKKKDNDFIEKLVKHGMNRDEAKDVKLIYNKNVFVEATKGIAAILEILEMVKDSFKEAMNEGPQAREPCAGVKIRLIDARLHEDAIHRGPAQVIPPIRSACREAMVAAKAFILEPKQIIRIDVPSDQLGGAMKEVQNRRGQIIDMTEEAGASILIAKIPVGEMFGFNSSLKSATSGRGFYAMTDILYEPMPKEIEPKVVAKIKERKGITGQEGQEG